MKFIASFLLLASALAKTDYSIISDESSCVSSGLMRIATKAECEKAAMAVGAWDTSAEAMPANVALSGCYIADQLYFSTPAESNLDDAAQAEFFELCSGGAADKAGELEDEWDRSARMSTGSSGSVNPETTYTTVVSMTVDLACTTANQELAQSEATAALTAHIGSSTGSVNVVTTSACASISLSSTITYDETARAASSNLQSISTDVASSTATIFSASNGWNSNVPTGVTAETTSVAPTPAPTPAPTQYSGAAVWRAWSGTSLVSFAVLVFGSLL